jgi:hypothetical protein
MTKKIKRLSPREAQRIQTTKERHGDDFFSKNARTAGQQTPTKFDSDRGRAAAKLRWDRWRAERAAKAAKKG